MIFQYLGMPSESLSSYKGLDVNSRIIYDILRFTLETFSWSDNFDLSGEIWNAEKNWALSLSHFDLLLCLCFTAILSLTLIFLPKNSREAWCAGWILEYGSVFTEKTRPIKLVSMWRTSPTQAEHFRILYMSQKWEEDAHIQEIQRLRGLFARANRKITNLERSFAELTSHRHPDVRPPLPSESHSILAIFLSELIENSTIDHPKARQCSSLAYYLSHFFYQCSPKAYRFLKQPLPLPSVSRLFFNFTSMPRKAGRLTLGWSESPMTKSWRGPPNRRIQKKCPGLSTELSKWRPFSGL
jgi:hypothetical protein